jgi:DNA adenine methylase
MSPFLKWAGGKRWLVQRFPDLALNGDGNYIEPFLGSGAVFFHMTPDKSILSDSNPDLVATFQAVRDSYLGVHKVLQTHRKLHSTKYYYELRAFEPTSIVERAARLIYLNATCFNGLYRVNTKGVFNVPIGDREPPTFSKVDFQKFSQSLRGTEILESDFEPIIDLAVRGDFVFADPPYASNVRSSSFVKYNEKLFSWGDQERLANALARAHSRGVKILSTNAGHPAILKLYAGGPLRRINVRRFTGLAASNTSRKEFEEVILYSGIPASMLKSK